MQSFRRDVYSGMAHSNEPERARTLMKAIVATVTSTIRKEVSAGANYYDVKALNVSV